WTCSSAARSRQTRRPRGSGDERPADNPRPEDHAVRRAPAALADADILTPRERQVAALVARGRSNREIAQALRVEVKTVEAHITHIIGKLDARSRVQIATWALEQGLMTAP
ncbi:MAG: response regulator transcription factor, partial [Chloroflexales bacterium]|nr:response regulator transcription factor [Chloroflexales bacterium]